MKNNKKGSFKLNNGKLKSTLTLLIIAGCTLTASAQKSTVQAALSKHGIDESILSPTNLKAPTDYAYELKQTTLTAGKSKEIVAKFDPSRTGDEQWTVVSVDGKTPSKGDINSFRKTKAKPESGEKTDDASYKIEKESADQLTFSYKMDEASLSKDAAALKDCRLYMTVNLRTKQIDQLQLMNEKPVKVGPLKADKFDMITKFTSSQQTKRYFPLNENLSIQAKFLGQAVNIQTITEYANYTKK